MRVRHKPWAKRKLQQFPDLVIANPKDRSGEWADVFGSDSPLHVEIGTGKGRFIVGMAQKYPEINFVGIEQNESIIVSALQKCLDANVKNVRLLHEDARGLTEYFAEDEVDEIYLNFCDPWPKRKHEKRRLTYASFLAQYGYVLKNHGVVNLKTDNQGFFEYSIESFSQYGFTLRNISLDLHRSEFRDNVMTEYEEKFSSMGQRIYRLEAVYNDD